MPVPPYHALFNPVLAAMKRLGDSATIAELDDEVIKDLGLTEAELATPHGERLTEIQYRLAWARSYLKGCVSFRNAIELWHASACGVVCLMSPTRPAAPRIPRPTVLRRAAVGPPRIPFHSCAGDGGSGRALRRGPCRSGPLTRTSQSHAWDSSVA